MSNEELLNNTFLRIAGVVNDSIVDGPSIRYTIFTQGCHLRCPGCHNPQTQDLNGGILLPLQTLYQEIKANPLVDGVTFSGGEPFLHAKELAVLARILKAENYSLWSYSGYTYEHLITQSDSLQLLQYLDVLVDGPFIAANASLELDFRGSSNQRIIDVQHSLQQKHVIVLDKYN